MQPQVILIDDESSILNALAQRLKIEGYQPLCFSHAEQALPLLEPDWQGVIISDINMPGMDGIEFLKQALNRDQELAVIMLTGHGDVSIAVEAMRLGAYDFLEKPFSNEHLLDVLRRATDKRRLVLENRELKRELSVQGTSGPRILGNNPKIKELRQILARVADIPADILVRGETGTGKDLVARYLHYNSKRSSENFVAINCGAIPENMIESELFGFEAGAFTSAQKRRIGKIEHANGGTFFLDEIESMPMALQIKLLRVLEERKIEPLGSNKVVDLDVRFIAAAKVDLKDLVEQGEFREDLYYRLNVINVEIPPLRERTDDISLLFQHFAAIASNRFGTDAPKLDTRQLYALQAHGWPGNIRELRNVAERFVLMGGKSVLGQDDPEPHQNTLSLADHLSHFERSVIQDALQQNEGRLASVQQQLGIARKTLYDKMRKYGLDKDQYKN
jgi:two-component system, NtrC family, C4-dicarboxylate transport response regulator DctD